MKNIAKEKTVLLFLAKGFEVYEAASFVDVIGWTEEVDMPKIRIKTVGMHPQIKAHWNMTVIPDMQIADVNVDEFDALAIPGGFEPSGFYEDGYDERIVQLIRDFHAQEKPIASICGCTASRKCRPFKGTIGNYLRFKRRTSTKATP